MRECLQDLISKTIVYKYDLPNSSLNIQKTIYSTDNDKCYSASNSTDIATIIYNSLIEYSFNEYDITSTTYEALHTIALRNKIKYNPDAEEDVKQKYGFFGEVLLFCILLTEFNAKPVIARGYFYNPLENSETKGYDSYHLVESDLATTLWFGEVKFYVDYKKAIASVLSNIHKALSDNYFETNLLEIHNQKNNLNIQNSAISKILESWEKNPSIRLIEEIKKNNLKFIYPILILYEEDSIDYEASIKKAVEYISEQSLTNSFSISIEYSVFFIFLPLHKVSEIKRQVIKWIESKQPLI